MTIQEELDKAVASEDFETAALLRDRINFLKTPERQEEIAEEQRKLDRQLSDLSAAQRESERFAKALSETLGDMDAMIQRALSERIYEVEDREVSEFDMRMGTVCVSDQFKRTAEYYWRGKKVLRVLFASMPPQIIKLNEL